jgi:hypothetical protein
VNGSPLLQCCLTPCTRNEMCLLSSAEQVFVQELTYSGEKAENGASKRHRQKTGSRLDRKDHSALTPNAGCSRLLYHLDAFSVDPRVHNRLLDHDPCHSLARGGARAAGPLSPPIRTPRLPICPVCRMSCCCWKECSTGESTTRYRTTPQFFVCPAKRNRRHLESA